ncbi:MAG: carboxylesterase [Hahellaceae bacterium]|jgi:phospholipase/carboxylesterase|nr:carboxylesterase [Hahellaceae bacterium]
MNPPPILPTLEIETGPTPEASIIWLHGLGADGHDFEPIIPELRLPASLSLRFIFPHAPVRPVTINGGYLMPAWYDIFEANLRRRVDTRQLRDSANAVEQLIEREQQRGIPAERVILAGFSQGGAVVLDLALRLEYTIGGLIALSTYLASEDVARHARAHRDLPIFVGHGTQDDIVSPQLGDESVALLKQAGFSPAYHRYAMGHSVCIQECQDIGHWLTQSLDT